MKDVSQSRHKKPEKITFEEVMGAAGMSGFGALLERRPGIEEPGWKLAAESRLKFLLKGAALAEKLGRQNDMLSSLNEPLTRRVTSLAQALGILSRITCAISNCRSSSLLRRGACVGSIRSAPTPAPCLGAGEETTLVIAERHYHTVAAGVPTNSPTVDLHTISSAAALSGCADATVRFTCTVFQYIMANLARLFFRSSHV